MSAGLLAGDLLHELLHHGLLGHGRRRNHLGRLVLLVVLRRSCCGLRRRCESLLVVHLVVVLLIRQSRELVLGLLLRGGRRTTRLVREEGGSTDARRHLVGANLLGLPAQTELATGEPHTGTLHQHRQLRTLDQDVLNRRALHGVQGRIVDVHIKLAVPLAQLNLHRRRIRLPRAAGVLGEAHGRRVELADELLAHRVLLEPRLGVLHALVHHELVQTRKSVIDGGDTGAASSVIVATQVQLHGILGGLDLVKHGHPKRGFQ